MKICAVVVFYRPDAETIAFVDRFASLAVPVVVVWNEFENSGSIPFAGNPAVSLIGNSSNLGLASALNMGIERAFSQGAQRVLLLDQDSRPDPEMAHLLSAALDRASADGLRVGLVGPTLSDRKAGGLLGARDRGNRAYQIVPRLSTSGSLIDRAVIETTGKMCSALFIDSIDHEWCYRAQSRGYVIIQSNLVKMEHDMGDAGVNFFGTFKPIHRSAFRHYHILRNTLWLWKIKYIPRSFLFSESLKLIYRIPVYFWVSSSRRDTIRAILKGLRDGLFLKPRMP